MHLPDIINKQKPTICFAIGLVAGMEIERSALLTLAQLLLLAAASIIQLRQAKTVSTGSRVRRSD